MAPAKDGRILRTTSKLNPPATGLDRALYLVVLSLWVCVGATWSTARARSQENRMTSKLEETNGHSGSVLKDIDWWKTGRAKLQKSTGIQSTPTRRMGHGHASAAESATGVAGDSIEGTSSSTGDGAGGSDLAAGVAESEGYAGTKDPSFFQEVAIEVGENSKSILRRILRGM